MTREKATKQAKLVLQEATENEDAVCHVTSADKEWLEMAVKALQIQPCEDAISRADAVKVASGYCHPSNIAEELAKLPPATPTPKTGHWIHLKHGKGKCSECHDVVLIAQMYGNANYCPNCGAKMIGSRESEKEEQ